MAGTVADLKDALRGPVRKDLMKRKPKSKVQFIPHSYKDTDSPTDAKPGEPGFDSEGKPRHLNLSSLETPDQDEDLA